MALLLILCSSAMLLSGPVETASLLRREQSANVSAPDYTETSALRKETLPPVDTTTLRPLNFRKCTYSSLRCKHGLSVCDDTNPRFSCQCDPGWSGFMCNERCPLTCVHGPCLVSKNLTPFCNCKNGYEGTLCDKLRLKPEVSTENSFILPATSSSALVVALVLIIVIPIIMWRLRVILILKLIYMFKEYEDEDGKEFDAYVSMTSTANTDSFVYGSLQPILENNDFKLFLQARDALAGEVMSETILSALGKSRRTIMIITPDYIKNEWSRFEYLIAQHEALKLQQRIIPIILEDVEKESVNMDKSLKHILDSVKCLKYPKVKPKSISSSTDEISENIQSPDSNKSVNSTTHFYVTGRSNSTGSLPKEDNQFERKVAKFWKRLVLTMPKKKSQQNTPISFLRAFRKKAMNDCSTSNCTKMECDLQGFSGFNFKINVINDINNDALSTNSDNSCKTKDLTEVSNKEAICQNDKFISETM